MTGVVLETLNIRKLICFGLFMGIIQISFFLIGGLISPSPNTSDQILMTKCIDYSNDSSRWHFTRPLLNESCREIYSDGDLEDVVPADVGASQIVFVGQFPRPRDGMELRMTRWFQQIIGVMTLDIKQKYGIKLNDTEITFDLRLGYRNRDDFKTSWHELAHSREVRPLKCVIDPDANKHDGQLNYGDDFYYQCDVLPLFSLPSCHHDEYLLNLRIPVDSKERINFGIGSIQDVWFVEIHQNGGFTKVWFSLKTFSFPISLLALCFFIHRVRELDRPATILEKTIVSLGIGLSTLNCPVEWLSLIYNVPFWLVLSDIRQGLFYAVLVCFWLVFTGEHVMQGSQSRSHDQFWGINRMYWPRLLLVAGCCSALFIFELAERGVQIQNPFYSIWSHPVSAKLGLVSIVIGALCAVAYMIYLGILVCRAFIQILSKRRLLSNLPKDQRLYYGGVIYRFTVLLIYTFLCAICTVAFFIFNQVTEDQWKWGERSIEYTSAFITGVYGMWNVYVVVVLCLYAPSHKFRSKSGQELYDRLCTNTVPLVHSQNADDNTENINVSGCETIQLVDIYSNRPTPHPTTLDGFKFIRKEVFD